MEEVKEYLDQIIQMCEHNIPFYAYGDNQAACELASRLSSIHGTAVCLGAALQLQEEEKLK